MYRPGREDPDLISSNTFREASTPKQSLGWYLDAVDKSEEAIENNPKVFLDKNFLARVDLVKDAMINFFNIDESDIYVTARQNQTKPFYVVKPSNHNFNLKSRQEKLDQLYTPIRSLGGFIKEEQKNGCYRVKIFYEDQSKGAN